MGSNWTRLNPVSAAQSMNSLSAPRSPMPRSFSLRNANKGARTPAILRSGDKFIPQTTVTKDTTDVFDDFTLVNLCVPFVRGPLSPASNLPILDQLIRDFFQET